MGANVHCWLVLALICAQFRSGSPMVKRRGWLGSIVAYHRNAFLNEIVNMPKNVEIEARIEVKPEGFEDHPDWDLHSVLRLLLLLRKSHKSRPVLRHLRRVLEPATRRLYVDPAFISKGLSYKLFPSITSDDYYDDSSSDSNDNGGFDPWHQTGYPDDDAIIVVSNPVESRLPSSQISARKLRQILEARAEAARMMPPTTVSTIVWDCTGDCEQTGGKDDSGGDDDDGTTKDDNGGGDDTTTPDAESTTESEPTT